MNISTVSVHIIGVLFNLINEALRKEDRTPFNVECYSIIHKQPNYRSCFLTKDAIHHEAFVVIIVQPTLSNNTF